MKDVTEGLVQVQLRFHSHRTERRTSNMASGLPSHVEPSSHDRLLLPPIRCIQVCLRLIRLTQFSSVQNLQTSIVDEKDGFYSLCTIYVSLCFTTLLISGQFVDKFKPKWSIAIGALCYLSFLIANRYA